MRPQRATKHGPSSSNTGEYAAVTDNGERMTQVDLGILQDQPILPSIVEGCDWNREIEPKLRAAALRRAVASTQVLALQDPRLGPTVVPVADGYAVFHGPGALSSFAREVGTSRPVSGRELSTLEQFYANRSCPVRVWVSNRTHSSFVEMLHGRGYITCSHSVNWFSLAGQRFNPCPTVKFRSPTCHRTAARKLVSDGCGRFFRRQ
jgi:hypothetical protein